MIAGEGRDELQCLLEKIYRERGFDFREYKETTLTRRLSRRLHARGAKTYASYADILDCDPTEYDRLFNDFTINVTSFFRDDIAYRALEEVAMPALIGKGDIAQVGHANIKQNITTDRSLRIWSAGCATGEEPYSVAMLLLEMLGEEIEFWNVTILGTDVDTKTLARARDGWFAMKDITAIRPAWLKKYFIPEGEVFRVRPGLRQLVTFELHNLVNDSPYRDLDLVVCRNVLIYFTPSLQTRVLKGFYEALKEGGFLLLGKAEGLIGNTRNLFAPVDSKAKLFRKVDGIRIARSV